MSNHEPEVTLEAPTCYKFANGIGREDLGHIVKDTNARIEYGAYVLTLCGITFRICNSFYYASEDLVCSECLSAINQSKNP